jgi:hypothetical protein
MNMPRGGGAVAGFGSGAASGLALVSVCDAI